MLHLASKSPRRRALLARLGVDFGLLDVDVPELRAPGESPEGYVARVAREKAGAGLLRVVAVPGATPSAEASCPMATSQSSGARRPSAR